MRERKVTDEDIAKLPARFRDYVHGLQGKIRELEAANAVQAETRVIVEPYGARKFLPDDTEVRFMLPARKAGWPMRRVDVRLASPYGMSGRDTTRSALLISGEDSIQMLPSASNQIYVESQR